MHQSKASITRREMLLAMIAGAAAGGCAQRMQPEQARAGRRLELILCGSDEVFIVSLAREGELDPRKVWSWRAAECCDIPDAVKRSFRSTDDCKGVDGGRNILVSSSSGAVALVERQSRRAVFHAEVVNAHSIETLPGGRIAAAASVGNSLAANRVVIFDIVSRRELASDPMYAAHGLVWDEKRSVLWALGSDRLHGYRVGDDVDRDGMKLDFELQLPDPDGHDLCPVPGTSLLFVSTAQHCWYFDRNARQLAAHESLKDAPRVKSYSVHPVAGRIAYVQAEGKNWWAQRVHFLKPEGALHLPGQRLYKARWVC